MAPRPITSADPIRLVPSDRTDRGGPDRTAEEGTATPTEIGIANRANSARYGRYHSGLSSIVRTAKLLLLRNRPHP